MMRLLPCFLLLCLALAACAPDDVTATPTMPAATTAPATATPSATSTPATPSPTSTPVLFAGMLTVQVNVRSGPGTTYPALGLLEAGQVVQVFAPSQDGAWVQINYPSAPDGFGWIAARYVTYPAGTPDFSALATAAFPPGAISGRILQRLNVRSGPGVSFEMLATLEAGTTIILTAKNPTASWFQIVHPPGSNKRGWVTAQYVLTEQAASLPIVDEYGNLVTERTPGASPDPSLPTATINPARPDGDSSASPAVRLDFATSGVERFAYSSQVSAPEGDLEDWIEFTPHSFLPGNQARLLFSLACTGNGELQVELWIAGKILEAWGGLACGQDEQLVHLPAGTPCQVRLRVAPGFEPALVHYSIGIQNIP